MKKKILALIICAMLVITAIPQMATSVFAQGVGDVITSATDGISDMMSRSTTGLDTNYPGGKDVLVVAPYEGTGRDV